MTAKPNKSLDNKSLDTEPKPVLTLQQNQSLTGRMYGLRQSALSLAAQCEQIIEYLRRKS
jgi:hypothetical protein